MLLDFLATSCYDEHEVSIRYECRLQSSTTTTAEVRGALPELRSSKQRFRSYCLFGMSGQSGGECSSLPSELPHPGKGTACSVCGGGPLRFLRSSERQHGVRKSLLFAVFGQEAALRCGSLQEGHGRSPAVEARSFRRLWWRGMCLLQRAANRILDARSHSWWWPVASPVVDWFRHWPAFLSKVEEGGLPKRSAAPSDVSQLQFRKRPWGVSA